MRISLKFLSRLIVFIFVLLLPSSQFNKSTSVLACSCVTFSCQLASYCCMPFGGTDCARPYLFTYGARDPVPNNCTGQLCDFGSQKIPCDSCPFGYYEVFDLHEYCVSTCMGATPPDETDHCWGPTINWEACEAGHEETLRATWYRWAKDGSSVWGDIKDMSYEKTPMAYSDITTSLHNICTYNWSVQFLGFLTIPKDGNYTFDLQYTPYSGNVKSIAFIYFDPATSKSGTYTPGCNTSNYLILDGSWYGLTGNGGPFNLKAGKYPFVAWYSVNESKSTYDLKLKWKKPGDSSFTIIPKSQYNPADFISGTACNYYESKCSMDVPLR